VSPLSLLDTELAAATRVDRATAQRVAHAIRGRQAWPNI
jgi:hypothetical protein